MNKIGGATNFVMSPSTLNKICLLLGGVGWGEAKSLLCLVVF